MSIYYGMGKVPTYECRPHKNLSQWQEWIIGDSDPVKSSTELRTCKKTA
jgi:hypothetical protein